MVLGRRKGSRGELQVAALLEQYWGRLEPGCRFKRTPGSGGWGGKPDAAVRAHFKVDGDLMTTAKHWPFCVEIKWREAFKLHAFQFGDRGRAVGESAVWAWWRQCCDAAANERTRPLLFFRNKQTPWLAMLDLADVQVTLAGLTRDGDRLNLFGHGTTTVAVFHAERLLDRLTSQGPWHEGIETDGDEKAKAGVKEPLQGGALERARARRFRAG